MNLIVWSSGVVMPEISSALPSWNSLTPSMSLMKAPTYGPLTFLVNARSIAYLTSLVVTSRFTGGLNFTPVRILIVSDLPSSAISGGTFGEVGLGIDRVVGLVRVQRTLRRVRDVEAVLVVRDAGVDVVDVAGVHDRQVAALLGFLRRAVVRRGLFARAVVIAAAACDAEREHSGNREHGAPMRSQSHLSNPSSANGAGASNPEALQLARSVMPPKALRSGLRTGR